MARVCADRNRRPNADMAIAPHPAATEDALTQRVLLLRAVEGDGEAFAELCRPFEARLLRQAQWLTGNDAAADELAQDTLIAAWKSLPRFQGRSQFFTWLCSILLFQHRSRLRRERGFRRWLGLMPTEIHEPAESQILTHPSPPAEETVIGPDEVIVAQEQSDRVRTCLLRLPDKHREVIFLRFYADESLEGIAAALNLSIGTVKSRLFHALQKLRHMRRDLTEPSEPRPLP